jgi:aarF domain-containing kinase
MEQSKLPKNLVKAMEKARAEAYKMPDLQLEAVMRESMGSDWESKFESFDPEPFAAASIG